MASGPIMQIIVNKGVRIMEQSESNQYFMDMFLEYFNNFATYEYFAEYFALDVEVARSIIDHGRKLYQAEFN